MTDAQNRSGAAESLMAPLALRPKHAAKALCISERLLWSKTNAGEIPHLRIGRALVYPVRELTQWLAEQAEGGRP